VIRTDEAIGVFRSVEIDWATESAKAKSLLRKLGGQNRSEWWLGKPTRGFVFSEAELRDLVERHPIRLEVPLCSEEKR
jgi:hypothetical protein